MRFEAVHLFVERAKAMQASFRHSDRDMPAIVEICQHLDGIPLALELAAARVRALSVEQIAARVNDRFRLLTSGNRTAQPRQQTLRAMIDWSYDLLNEQRAGALAAARGVRGRLDAGGRGGRRHRAAASTRRRCSTCCRVSSTSHWSCSTRTVGVIGLLETVRQYAHELLVKSGEEEDARARHLRLFLALAEKARPELVGPRQAAWLVRLDLERENLLAAHAWCMHAKGGGESALSLINGVKLYWASRGQLGLRYRLTVEALAHADAQQRNLVRCRGLFNAGQACYFMGRYDEAIGFLEESLAIARDRADKANIEAALSLLGLASLGRGDITKARRYIVEALALAREQRNKHEIAAAANGLAQFHRVVGELDAAEPLYEEVLGLAREIEDKELVAIAKLNLAMVAISRGAIDQAHGNLLDAMVIAKETGSRPMGQSAIEVTAGLAASHRKWETAAKLFGAAEAQVMQTGLHRDPADEAFLGPLVARARDAIGAVSFNVAEAGGRALSFEDAMQEAEAFLTGPH